MKRSHSHAMLQGDVAIITRRPPQPLQCYQNGFLVAKQFLKKWPKFHKYRVNNDGTNLVTKRSAHAFGKTSGLFRQNVKVINYYFYDEPWIRKIKTMKIRQINSVDDMWQNIA